MYRLAKTNLQISGNALCGLLRTWFFSCVNVLSRSEIAYEPHGRFHVECSDGILESVFLFTPNWGRFIKLLTVYDTIFFWLQVVIFVLFCSKIQKVVEWYATIIIVIIIYIYYIVIIIIMICVVLHFRQCCNTSCKLCNRHHIRNIYMYIYIYKGLNKPSFPSCYSKTISIWSSFTFYREYSPLCSQSLQKN